MEELIRSLADYSIAIAILFSIVWVGISGRVISKSVVAFYEKRLNSEREYWQGEIDRVREVYETRYFDLVTKHDEDVRKLYSQLIGAQSRMLQQREQQMAAFIKYVDQYQQTQDEVAQFLRKKLNS